MKVHYREIMMGLSASFLSLSIILWVVYGWFTFGVTDIQKTKYIWLDWMSTDLLIIGSIIFGVYLGTVEITRQMYESN